MALPLMQKATAVWLVENTTLTFRQIAEFCGLHELEVNGIADGEVAQGIKGFDPIANRQLTAEEIKRGEGNPAHNLRLYHNPAAEGGVVNDTERLKLVSTEQSLAMEAEPRLPSSMSGLENFRLGTRKEGSPQSAKADAESLFNLAPADSHDDEDE